LENAKNCEKMNEKLGIYSWNEVLGAAYFDLMREIKFWNGRRITLVFRMERDWKGL